MPFDRGKEFANHYKLSFHETSAKCNIGIEECMEDIINKTIKHKFGNKNLQAREKNGSIKLSRASLTSKNSNGFKQNDHVNAPKEGKCCY